MATAIEVSDKRRMRLKRLAITSVLMGVSFAIGVAVTAVIAVSLVLPVAVSSLGLASESANAIVSNLYSGDSEMRLTVLTYLKKSFETQPSQKYDSPTVAWILPAVEQCKTDSDPKVVELASEVADHINNNTVPPPQ